MPVTDVAHRLGHRALDAILGVPAGWVLNSGEAPDRISNPAQDMMQASKARQAVYVDPDSGTVDYEKLAQGPEYEQFQRTARSLQNCRVEDLGAAKERTAFWINLYNALIVHAIVHFKISTSMMRNPGIFRSAAYAVGKFRLSADDIEHGILRANRKHPYFPLSQFGPSDPRRMLSVSVVDPRIHFALVCGAASCPPIAFYDALQLDAQLDSAAGAFINGHGVRFDDDTNTLWLSKIFKWYRRDFGGLAQVLDLIKMHATDEVLLEALFHRAPRLRSMKYNWSVNRS